MNNKSTGVKHRSRKKDAARKEVLAKRLARTNELARAPTTTVTLRLPAGLNEWLDAYVHGVWPAKIRKQDLVIEALRLLIVRRGGPREEVLDTDLLGNNQQMTRRGQE